MKLKPNRRFINLYTEITKCKNTCQKCGLPLSKIEYPTDQLTIGIVANYFPYMYCKECNLYYICLGEKNNNGNQEESQ